MDLNKLKLDSAKDAEGVWVNIGDGAEIKVARIGTKEYNKVVKAVTGPHRTAIERGYMNDEEADKLSAKIFSQAVLLDWKGIQIDGVEVPYSQEKAAEILGNPDFSEFRGLVSDEAHKMDNFRQNEIETDVGKSEKPSAGNSNTANTKTDF